MDDVSVLLVEAEAIRVTLLYCGLSCTSMHDVVVLFGKGTAMRLSL